MSGRWTPDFFDALRGEGDPVADAAIAEFVGTHATATPRSVMESLVRVMRPGDEEPTPLLACYLKDEAALPDWHDPDLLRRGQEFFTDWALPIASALFCASLPVAYSSAKGAQVIVLTGELVSTPRRRIAETAQMIADVMNVDLADGGRADMPLAPGTRGYRSARGVRLMHGAVRHFITCDPTASSRYDAEKWGRPANQEDLLGTLFTFTTVVLDALHKLGISSTEAEAEAYMHTWCVVGHLLGLRSDLMPLHVSEAAEVNAMIRRRQCAPSPAGTALMAALLDEMRDNMPWGCKEIPAALVRQVSGRETADILAVPSGGWSRALLLPVSVGDRIWSRTPLRHVVGAVGRMTARRTIKAYVDRARVGRPPWDFDSMLRSAPVLRTRLKRARRAVGASPMASVISSAVPHP
jgi:ER-bound oxygenase mpaB/B'/Rubber oxygenase, catalytic domain